MRPAARPAGRWGRWLLGLPAGALLWHVSLSAAIAPPSTSSTIRALLAAEASAAQSPPRAPPAAPRLHDAAHLYAGLCRLYAQRSYAPLWSQEGHPSGQLQGVLALLASAADYGLDPEDYQLHALAQALQRLQTAGSPPSGAGSWASFDVTLSGALLGFVSDLHRGRLDPQAVGFELPATEDSFDAVAWVAALASSPAPASLVASAEPQFIHYRLLEQALRRYRTLASMPGLTDLPAPSGSLNSGDRYAGAPALRRLLIALGCLPAGLNSTATRIDPELALALRQFQTLDGLQADGVLGARTYAALTTPLFVRVRQIELTLERWRWLNPLSGRTIIVNIPQFRLFAFDSASDRELGMLRMNVIVGEGFRDKRTPIFAATLRTVVFRPYWDVPHSIVVREILPKLRRDPNYLQSQHMELVDGPRDDSPVLAASAENLALLKANRLRLRQRPGSDNALGLVKFLLPNRHDVYLHDTPQGELFARASRAFSHGCIRVGDPVGLAEYVLKDTPGGWTQAQVQSAMHGDSTQRINLALPLTVLIVYGTAVAGEDGTVHFFEDLYGYDRRLESLLDLPPPRAQPSR